MSRPFFARVLSNTNTTPLLLLDNAVSLCAAYSLRRLRTAYMGAPIRVRRSSDSTELDIPFTGSGDLNQTLLLAFTGSGDGFVSKWYDQSGNNFHVTSSAAAQPKIVAAGVVNKQNTLPAVIFNGSTSGLSTSTQAPLYASAMSRSTVFQATNTTTGNVMSSDSSPRCYFLPDCSINFGNTTLGATTTTGLMAVAATVSGLNGAATQIQYLNGVATSGTTNRSGTAGVISLGAFGPGIASSYYSGSLSEAIQWNRTLTAAEIGIIQANQKVYYGTP